MRRLVFAIGLFAACGDEDGGGPIPISELGEAFVNAYCNVYVTCGLIDDISTCRQLDIDIEIDASLIAAIEAGKVIYHPDKARTCLNGITGSCDRLALNRSNNTLACDETFEGTVAAGGQCAIDEECQSASCDVPACPDACCQGTCVGDAPPARPRLGESCAETTACVDSFCDATTLTCAAYRPNGEACTSTNQCAAGACTNQICTALPKTGEACIPSQTTSNVCRDLGDTCSATSNTCVAYGLTGDPCTAATDCSPIYWCGAGGTCQLRPRLGDACGSAQVGGSCIDRSYCDATVMTCTAPQADGATCSSDSQCTSRNCDFDTGQCTTPPICI